MERPGTFPLYLKNRPIGLYGSGGVSEKQTLRNAVFDFGKEVPRERL